MVRINSFPSHGFSGPIRSMCVRSSILEVLIVPTGLGFDAGLVLLLFRHAVQVPVPGPDSPLASGRDLRVSKEMCPYLSWRPWSVSLLTLKVMILVSSGIIHIVPVIPRLMW